MAAYRATVHEATGYSPNFLMFGRELRAPIDLVWGGPGDPEYANPDDFVEAVRLLQREAYALARDHLKRRAERNKNNYDVRARPVKFEIGNWVWYYNPRKYVGRSPKWQRNYTGPFLVVEVLSAVNVMIQKSRKANKLVVHIDKLTLFMGDAPAAWVVDDSLDASGESQMESPAPSDFARVDMPAGLGDTDNEF